jgi:hypothetical protein
MTDITPPEPVDGWEHEAQTFVAVDSAPQPVELLRDQRGVYGIGVSDLFDFEAVAWSCGVEPEPYTFERAPRALILRPDERSAIHAS